MGIWPEVMIFNIIFYITIKGICLAIQHGGNRVFLFKLHNSVFFFFSTISKPKCINIKTCNTDILFGKKLLLYLSINSVHFIYGYITSNI